MAPKSRSCEGDGSPVMANISTGRPSSSPWSSRAIEILSTAFIKDDDQDLYGKSEYREEAVGVSPQIYRVSGVNLCIVPYKPHNRSDQKVFGYSPVSWSSTSEAEVLTENRWPIRFDGRCDSPAVPLIRREVEP